MSIENQSAINAGNYYTSGARRILAKLASMGITVPESAIGTSPGMRFGAVLTQYTPLERALMDWFEGRDYTQAQALIHFRPAASDYHVIRILDAERCPSEIEFDTICPSLIDAAAAVIHGCDTAGERIDSFRRLDGEFIVKINGVDAVKIEAVAPERFDVGVRDRVRNALKGVRQYDNHEEGQPG